MGIDTLRETLFTDPPLTIERFAVGYPVIEAEQNIREPADE